MNIKKILAVLIVLVIVVLIMFLWQESLTFSVPVNHEKVTNFFLLCTSLVTTISIFYLGLQLKEQKETRLANARPDIYPQTVRFKMLAEDLSDLQSNVPPSLKGVFINDEEREIVLTIDNIGNGSAKQLEIEWIYNTKAVTEMFHEKYSYWDVYSSDSDSIDFIRANSCALVDMPYYYLMCCGAEFNREGRVYSDEITIQEKPALHLKILYSDVYNEPHRKLYRVIIDAVSSYVTFKFKLVN